MKIIEFSSVYATNLFIERLSLAAKLPISLFCVTSTISERKLTSRTDLAKADNSENKSADVRDSSFVALPRRVAGFARANANPNGQSQLRICQTPLRSECIFYVYFRIFYFIFFVSIQRLNSAVYIQKFGWLLLSKGAFGNLLRIFCWAVIKASRGRAFHENRVEIWIFSEFRAFLYLYRREGEMNIGGISKI